MTKKNGLIEIINIASYTLLIAAIVSACTTIRNRTGNSTNTYKSDNQELFNTILSLDSIFWEAYNSCNLDLQSKFYSDSIEFYHDQAGLITSKQAILEATKNNICGKIIRKPVEGSIEIFPINGFGAIETGKHIFYDTTKLKDPAPQMGKFIFIWQHKNNTWTIRKAISLHN